MQSRPYFSMGPKFGVITDSLIIYKNDSIASSIPPGSDVMITESGIPMITESGSTMITE